MWIQWKYTLLELDVRTVYVLLSSVHLHSLLRGTSICRSDAGHFSTAKILTPEHFGSNGIGPNHAVVDGPFGSQYTHNLVEVDRPNPRARIRRLDPPSRARQYKHRTQAHEDRRRDQLHLRPSKVSFTNNTSS